MSDHPESPITENSDSLIPTTSPLPYLQFASILLKGLEKLAEIQKMTLDIYEKYARETGDAAESLKQMFPVAPVPLFEMAEEAIRTFLQMQVNILDLMLNQTRVQVESIRTNGALDYERNIARLMRSSADCLLEMQEKAFGFFAQQNNTFAAEATGSAVQDGTDAIIQAQKKFWDVTLKPFKAWQAEASQAIENMMAAGR